MFVFFRVDWPTHSTFRTPEASENPINAAWEHCRRIAKI
jgi:hypothetical protein